MEVMAFAYDMAGARLHLAIKDSKTSFKPDGPGALWPDKLRNTPLLDKSTFSEATEAQKLASRLRIWPY